MMGGPKRFSLSEDMVELAQHAMMPMPCEWEACQIVLNSWQTLLKVNVTIHQSHIVAFSTLNPKETQ